MFADTRPAELSAAGGIDPWAEFRVDHPRERLALLRQLRDGSVPVSLNGPGGAGCTSVLWSVDERAVVFDGGATGTMLQPLLDAGEGLAVAYLDSVKLQFELQALVLVRAAQGSALRAALPQEVYRFQRRQSYRVRTGERTTAPLARLRHPAIPDMLLELRVLDVSLGGCALWLPADVPPLTPDTLLGQVEMALDADTRFVTGLRIRHAGVPAAAARGARLGCEWQLAPMAERALQRFIDLAQKRRRLMALE